MIVAIPVGGTDAGRSGLGTYVKEILPRVAARLEEQGHHAEIYGTSAELEAYASAIGNVRTHVIDGPIASPAASALWHMTLFTRAARRDGADVVLWPAANRRTDLAAALPSVAVVHDLAPLRLKNKYGILRDLYARKFVLTSLSRATRLVAISNATRKDLLDYLGENVAVSVAPNGVDAKRFSPASREVERPVWMPERSIVYVSRLEHPGKNHLRLVQAFAQSEAAKTHSLILAGDDWGARSMIETEVARLALGSRVILPGRVSERDLAPMLAHADAAVMLGLHEGFGLPALEAIACGTPVLASSTGALPEVVGELGVLVDPLSVDAIQVGLDRVVTSGALRELVREQGPIWARTFTWESTADALVSACIEAAKEGEVAS